MGVARDDRYAPTPRATWGVLLPPVTPEELRQTFSATDAYTVGVEEELMLVAADTLDLAPAIEPVLAELGADPRFRQELRAAQIEIVTPVCASAAHAESVLREARRTLGEAGGELVAIAAAGTHPRSTSWGQISPGERYQLIAELYPWASQRGIACGMHVHVAIGDADRALAVYNALRSYVPELAALSANSPFLEGRDTGHASIRASLNEAFPRAGIPPAFSSWKKFVDLLDWGRSSGSFPDATFLWWELRPHPGFGTLELRVADCQTAVEDAGAVAAVAQSLAAWLGGQYDAGEALPVHDAFRIAENRWSALRFGLGGWLLDLDSGAPRPTRARLTALLDDLEPLGARLGCADQLEHARTLIADNGAERQRYVAERDGLDGLLRWLVRRTVPGAA